MTKRIATALAVTLLAGSAQAATITATTAPQAGREWVLSTNQFDASESPDCGSGGSIEPGTCQVQLVTNNSGAARYGRFNPLDPNGNFIDSQDLSHITWTITATEAFTRLTFAVMDANDTGDLFRIDAFGGEGPDTANWTMDTDKANGNIEWLNLDLALASTTAVLKFTTTRNDGFAVAAVRFDNDVTLAPVPLPATVGLLAAGLAGLGALRRRKRAARG